MKLYYSKILLFVIPLNILIISLSNAHNKNKLYTTPGHIQTNRSLCECNTQSSIYDNDADMKSVKEIFDRQTSQRFEEYEERMKGKRQKRKEERDKNIKKIIDKDKMEKSLAEKVEKGCLRCGCALGGGVLPVWGLVSGLWYATWSQYVTQKAIQKGIEEGIATVVTQLEDLTRPFFSSPIDISGMVNAKTYRSSQALYTSIYREIQKVCDGSIVQEQVCTTVGGKPLLFTTDVINATAKGIDASKSAQAKELAELTAKSSHIYSAIGYSVLAILIIVLVMIIIYLILRYRRKKKMNKKAQYTKLLNQ
ncbi:rifin PIR protein, putative [Plasmodium reichenowi]|uniref:Rifin PIR protein, putative n=1 Tax=Plasmodium reichenowi TaxID=5854 RepID=A0A2P9DBK5_PLARE|nr:rifin PIR protein, putative [Plasmodium reichenowi]